MSVHQSVNVYIWCNWQTENSRVQIPTWSKAMSISKLDTGRRRWKATTRHWTLPLTPTSRESRFWSKRQTAGRNSTALMTSLLRPPSVSVGFDCISLSVSLSIHLSLSLILQLRDVIYPQVFLSLSTTMWYYISPGLSLSPLNVPALLLRCEALDGLGKEREAFDTAAQVWAIEPRHPRLEAFLLNKTQQFRRSKSMYFFFL